MATTTDAQGAFAFDREPSNDLAFGSILIALHSSYFVGGLDLGLDLKKWQGGAEILLEASTPVTVQVLGPTGAAQPGAIVHHVSIPLDLVALEAAPLATHEGFFAQESITGADGRVDLAPFVGSQVFWATKDDLISVPWQGPKPSTVTLTLESSFTVGGTISFPNKNEWEAGYEGERRILVAVQTGNLSRPLAALRDVQEGEWGPIHVPIAGSRYSVRMEGAPISPLEVVLERPKASTHYRVDFAAEKKCDLYLYVVEESGKIITNARAKVWWGDSLRGMGQHHSEGASRPDGYLYLGTFPPGSVRFEVSAPGYGSEGRHVEVPRSFTLEIILPKAGSVSGRCAHEGTPVSDFELIYWKEANPRIPMRKEVIGQSNGAFELFNLSKGDWSVSAASASYPSGKPVIVRVEAGKQSTIEVELPSAIRGSGRILDAANGEALADAVVQAYSSGGMERSYPWGPSTRATSDGSFDMDAFVLGSNFLRVSAGGYAETDVKAIATNREFLDWGEIRLFRPQSLQIALLGMEELEDQVLTGLCAFTADGYLLPAQYFTEEGTVCFEAVPPGDYKLIVASPNGYWTRLQFKLDPGREWRVEHKVGGDKKVTIRVVDEKRQPLADETVTVAAQEPNGILVLQSALTSGEGLVTFQGIQAGKVLAWCIGADGAMLGNKDLSFGSSSSVMCEIQLGEKPFRIRIVDPEGDPVAGAKLTIRALNGVDIHGVGDTGADGWASLFGMPKTSLLLDVHHGIAGWSFGTTFSAVGEEFVFVLNATGFVELEVKDGAEPLADVSARIETMGGVTLSHVRQTDARGLVRFDALGPGSYHLACRRADCWTVLIDRQLDVDEKTHLPIQMRRLADLELTVRNGQGVPVSGATIDLDSIEFEVPVSSWIQEKQVSAPAGLTTDLHGEIRIEGLPRGAYIWSMSAAGASLTGSFELVPSVTNRVPIQLPQ